MTIILNCGVLLQKTLEFSDNTIKRPEQWRKGVRSVNNDWIRRHFLRSAKEQIDGDKPQTEWLSYRASNDDGGRPR